MDQLNSKPLPSTLTDNFTKKSLYDAVDILGLKAAEKLLLKETINFIDETR